MTTEQLPCAIVTCAVRLSLCFITVSLLKCMLAQRGTELMQVYTADGSNLHSVYKALFSLLWHTRVWQNSQGKTKSYMVQKGFARLSEALLHYTEGYQGVQGYIKEYHKFLLQFWWFLQTGKTFVISNRGHC